MTSTRGPAHAGPLFNGPTMRKTLLACSLALSSCLLLAGCLSVPSAPYQAGVQNSGKLLAGHYKPMRAGKFDAAVGVEDRAINVRGANTLTSGARDGTFSGYLREALEAELATAGLLDHQAPVTISGTLLQNRVDAGSARSASAVVGARFVVERNGQVVYDRVLTARHAWDSSFMAAIAVPTAFQNHAAAIQKLLGQLFADPDFERATSD